MCVRRFRKRSAGLVVGYVALSGVGKEGKDCGHPLRRCGLAGRDCDEQFHQIVIDLPTAGLYDVDILFPDRLFNLDPSLADRELGEEYLRGGNTQVIADGLVQARVGAAPKNDNVSDHVGMVTKAVRVVTEGRARLYSLFR